MKTCVAVLLFLFGGVCFAQVSPDGRPQNQTAYPESEAAAISWRDSLRKEFQAPWVSR